MSCEGCVFSELIGVEVTVAVEAVVECDISLDNVAVVGDVSSDSTNDDVIDEGMMAKVLGAAGDTVTVWDVSEYVFTVRVTEVYCSVGSDGIGCCNRNVIVVVFLGAIVGMAPPSEDKLFKSILESVSEVFVSGVV